MCPGFRIFSHLLAFGFEGFRVLGFSHVFGFLGFRAFRVLGFWVLGFQFFSSETAGRAIQAGTVSSSWRWTDPKP